MFYFSETDQEYILHELEIYAPQYNLTDAVICGNDLVRDPLATITLFTTCVPMFPIYSVVIYVRRNVYRLLDGISLQALSAPTKIAHRKLMMVIV